MTERATFAAAYGPSAAELGALDRYAALLTEWQARMNLVAASTLPHIWSRHFDDSAQLAGLAEASAATVWLDLGSGAGFPAIILAILAPGRFHLVEATAKKCAFLATVAEAVGVADRVTIHNRRIETMPPLAADIVTARACASLAQLFDWGERFAGDGRWLLLKGRSAADEVADAARQFTFDHRLVPSRTAADARIVDARNVRRRRG